MVKQTKIDAELSSRVSSLIIKNIDDYTMFLRTVQASAIRTLSESIKEILTDVTIYFDESGLRIMNMDTSKVAFVYLKLDADKFENYHCPKSFSIGLNLISLHKLLKTINNSDIITLYIEKNNTNKLGIKIENHDKKIISISKLKLIDLDENGIDIPDVTFDYIFNMPCVDFQKHCRDLFTISEKVKIFSKGDLFTMYASGDFAEQEIQIGDDNSGDKEKKEIGTFPLKYLNLFCKSTGLCPTVEIYFKKDFPIILQYSVAALGSVKFGLAPTMEDSD